MRLILEVKDPTEEVRLHILYHFCGGIFRLRSRRKNMSVSHAPAFGARIVCCGLISPAENRRAYADLVRPVFNGDFIVAAHALG